MQALEDNAVTPGKGPLRRSSRRSKKLFNPATIEQDESPGSGGEESSPSMDEYSDPRAKKSRVCELPAIELATYHSPPAPFLPWVLGYQQACADRLILTSSLAHLNLVLGGLREVM